MKYVYVVSTDIKKSSALWNFQQGAWMKNHILLHHVIIHVWADNYEFTIMPNSPEGDAFIMFKIVQDNTKEIRRQILSAVETLQRRFEYYRNVGALLIKKNTSITKKQWESLESVMKEPGIHIRLGVASGVASGSKSDMEEYTYTFSSFTPRCNRRIKSYRGKVIEESENMEGRFKSLDGYCYLDLVTQNRDPYCKRAEAIHQTKLTEPWQLMFVPETDVRFRRAQTEMTEVTQFATVAFVKGKIVYEPNNARIEPIKVKRDTSSMWLFYPEPTASGASIGETSLNLALEELKKFQSQVDYIGLSFGKINISSVPFIYNNRTQQSTSVCNSKDIFGDPVNIAARAALAGIDEKKRNELSDTLTYFYGKRKGRIVLLFPWVNNNTSPMPQLTLEAIRTSFGSIHLIERSQINAGEGKLWQTWLDNHQ